MDTDISDDARRQLEFMSLAIMLLMQKLELAEFSMSHIDFESIKNHGLSSELDVSRQVFVFKLMKDDEPPRRMQ